MSTTTTRVCDHCGKQQGDTNHWFVVCDRAECVLVSQDGALSFDEDDNMDACGEECALRLAYQVLHGEHPQQKGSETE